MMSVFFVSSFFVCLFLSFLSCCSHCCLVSCTECIQFPLYVSFEHYLDPEQNVLCLICMQNNTTCR
ncbi:hypothetical protein K457DRAFT_141143 [Linnemannia elongata AG-77]|uniref:Secreted protein n=1 Tax=Linnemannia elongata AG-77 TaxID=1314771 RepID=A0A197JLX7_9FUNG|nr:hypothetical protein K457DRAFT_141143 [Linnemannia elongata AG-77]